MNSLPSFCVSPFMKAFLFLIGITLFFTGCSRTPFDEGAAAIVVYEPISGESRTLKEDLHPYVQLYSDFVIINYTRTNKDNVSKPFTHVIPTSKLGFVRWLDPQKGVAKQGFGKTP